MPNFDMPPEMVSVDYVCRLFMCSRMTVRRWIACGRLPGLVEIGPNKVGFPADEIKQHYDRLLAERGVLRQKEFETRFRVWHNGKARIYALKGSAAELLASLVEHGSIEADNRASAALLDLRVNCRVPVRIREKQAPENHLPMLHLETAVEIVLADVAA